MSLKLIHIFILLIFGILKFIVNNKNILNFFFFFDIKLFNIKLY